MNTCLISMFIDDEMDLPEKIELVETIHGNRTFKECAIDLLNQERLLRSAVVEQVPPVEINAGFRPTIGWNWFKPAALAIPALAALLLIALLLPTRQTEKALSHRFVLFQPTARQAGISGSFTDWQTLPLTRMGTSGYWVITLELPRGEHRFTYIIDGHQRLIDPTVPGRETDDFGGQNSIMYVGV